MKRNIALAINLSLLTIVAEAATGAQPAQVANGNSTYAVIGYGNSTCVQYLAANREEYAALETWVAGFLTGVNAFSAASSGLNDIDHGAQRGARQAWISEWCTTHPQNTLASAAQWYVIERRKSR